MMPTALRRFLFLHSLFSFLCLLPSSLHSQEQLKYVLHVQVHPQTRDIRVQGSVTLRVGKNSQDSMVVALAPTKATPELSLPGTSFRLSILDSTAARTLYCFRFTRPVKTGATLTLAFAYQLRSEPQFQYYIDSTFFMASGYGTAWYPQVLPGTALGLGNACRATGVLTVQTDAPFRSVMAAATVDSLESQTNRFHYKEEDIFSLYVGRYAQHVFQGTLPFSTYTLSPGVDGDALAQQSAQVLHYLGTLFGPLQIPNFSIIELPQPVADRTNLGGASLLGGVLMPTDALRRFNYALFGHEIGHQWWGNQIRVTGEKGDALLSEGLAQYGSLQVVQHFDSAHALTYRKKGYPGYIYDQSGLGYLKNVAAKNDAPLASLHGINAHLIADSKGFLALDLLSEIMGKAAFHKCLQQIQNQYKQQGLTWTTFLAKLDSVHGSSLHWFCQQWFERTGAPSWNTAWKADGKAVTVTITQLDSLYRLPLTVQINYKDGTTTQQKIWLQHQTDVFVLPARKGVKEVAVDPYFQVLHWAEDLRPIAGELSKAQQVLILFYKQKLEEAEQLAYAYLKEDSAADPYGLLFTLWSYLGRIKSIENKTDEALEAYSNAVQCVTRPPELLARTYYKIAVLSAAKGEQARARQAAANAVKADNLTGGMEGMEMKVKPLF